MNVFVSIFGRTNTQAEICAPAAADTGREFAYHEKIGNALGADVYSAHPYRSWQRGLNASTNGSNRSF